VLLLLVDFFEKLMVVGLGVEEGDIHAEKVKRSLGKNNYAQVPKCLEVGSKSNNRCFLYC
jgi:hypothetical protein